MNDIKKVSGEYFLKGLIILQGFLRTSIIAKVVSAQIPDIFFSLTSFNGIEGGEVISPRWSDGVTQLSLIIHSRHNF